MSANFSQPEDRRFKGPDALVLGSVIEPVVQGAGFYLEELELKPDASRVSLRLVVDYQDGGELVSLDDVALISGKVSEALDAAENLKDTDGVGENILAAGKVLAGIEVYDLEVSTPGATRLLREPRHFRRNIGRLLEITTVDGQELLGRLESVDLTGISIAEQKPAPKKGMPVKYLDSVVLSFDSLKKARVQVEFSHMEND